MGKNYYIVRMPRLERPPIQDYNHCFKGKFFSTMASSPDVALRNILWRIFKEEKKGRITYRYLHSNFSIEEICLNADEVTSRISFFDERKRRARPNETERYYAFVNEVTSSFGVKTNVAMGVANEYFDRKCYQ